MYELGEEGEMLLTQTGACLYCTLLPSCMSSHSFVRSFIHSFIVLSTSGPVSPVSPALFVMPVWLTGLTITD